MGQAPLCYPGLTGIILKHLFASLLLCFCLSTTTLAANSYNSDWRSLPFIEMMAAMMKAMNNVLGIGDDYNGFNSLPYSPAFMPGMGGLPYFNNFNQLPMSPSGFNSLPMNQAMSSFQDGFKTGQNSSQFDSSGKQTVNNFWDPDATHFDATETTPARQNNNINGIWQAISGDVIAIYNNNRFLWSDGGARNLAGYLAIKGNNMIAYIPAKKVTLLFQFYKEPGQFIVRDQNARVYTFKRIH